MKKLCFLLVLASFISCTSTPQTDKQGQKQADSPKNELPKINKDKDTLVIVTHGIVKKTQKTPNKEIAKAEAIRKYYFENKKY